MFARTRAVGAALSIIALLAAGCARTGAPSGWLPSPEETLTETHGAWIRVESADGGDAFCTEGEFLAVTEDTVFVLVTRDTQACVAAIPRVDIQRARLGTHDARVGGVVIWTFLGTLSTISHGIGLILTAPTWVLAGSVAAGVHSRTAIEDVEEDSGDVWVRLKVYGRFPQGLPEGVDRASIRPRSPTSRRRRDSSGQRGPRRS